MRTLTPEEAALRAQVSYRELSFWQRLVVGAVAGRYVDDANRALDLAAAPAAARRVGPITGLAERRGWVQPRR
jgi:hypothetical protein